MYTKKLSPNLSVAGQLGTSDIAVAKTMGFNAIICNRPDGEESDQLSYKDMEIAARRAGLKIRYVPIFHTGITERDARDFSQAMQDLPKPVLAYCRTGTRSAYVAQQSGCLNSG